MNEPPRHTDTELPDGLHFVRTTDEFDHQSVPAGLLRAHRVAAGVWGRLVVRAGSVQLVFEDDPDHPVEVRAGGSAPIPPQRPHHVVPDAAARFAVEFHRWPVETPIEFGRESTGLTGGDP